MKTGRVSEGDIVNKHAVNPMQVQKVGTRARFLERPPTPTLAVDHASAREGKVIQSRADIFTSLLKEERLNF
jgi:hypothetical protein